MNIVKKLLSLSFLVLLIAVMISNSLNASETINPITDKYVVPDASDVVSDKHNQGFSETALEYRVNKPVDPSINKTVVDPNPGKSLDYASREPKTKAPDLNGTADIVLYTNSSIISFAPTDTGIDNQANNGEFVIDSFDPNRPAASLLPVTKEGHWFPNMDHSRIRYEVYTPYFDFYSYPFHIDVSQGDDPYARYFRIYWDGNMIHDQVISSAGFHSDFSINAFLQGSHRLEFEIWSGYYSDHAWIINNFRPIITEQLDPKSGAQITAEYFPFTAYGRLRWNVYMGQQTEAEVKIERVDDPYYRDLKFFVDGVQIQPSSYAPCDITYQLGSYTHGSYHEIMLEVSWCDYREWGYKMPKFRVHYGGAAAEIDYLYSNNEGYNHRPSDDILNYMQVWYVEFGYQRYHLFIDDAINADTYGASTMTGEIYNQIMNNHFDLNYMYGVNYLLVGHYDEVGTTCGWNYGEQIFIADQACANYASSYGWLGFSHMDVTRCVLMHECGHSIHIYEGSGGNEQYCSNTFCVMSQVNIDNCAIDNPWYCQTHWDEADFPDF